MDLGVFPYFGKNTNFFLETGHQTDGPTILSCRNLGDLGVSGTPRDGLRFTFLNLMAGQPTPPNVPTYPPQK